MCQGSSKPTEEEAASLLHALQQRFMGLCALLHCIIACQAASPTLRAAVSGAAKALLTACTEFLDALPEQVHTSPALCNALACMPWARMVLTLHVLRRESHVRFAAQSQWPGLPQRVGLISERCAAVQRLPLDSKVAIGRKLMQVKPFLPHFI